MLDVKKSRLKIEKAKLLSIAGEKTKIKFSHAGTVRGNLDVKMPIVVRQGHKQACVSGADLSHKSAGVKVAVGLMVDSRSWMQYPGLNHNGETSAWHG